MSKSSSQVYPKPGPLGGQLIREVVSFLRLEGLKLPLDSHILVAISGGSDSVGLAHLLIHYGRRIVSRQNISLLHINHRWRGDASDQDELFIQKLGESWGVPVISHRLKSPPAKNGQSWENEARNARKEIYQKEAQERNALVFTGHQADDLAETVLWRVFTGAALTHGAGIAFQHGVEVRPFLKQRKETIKTYLQEVGQSYREDSTNHSERFLRARMRQKLMPEVEKLFPRAIDHLLSLAFNARRQMVIVTETPEAEVSRFNQEMPQKVLLQAAGLKLRRCHFEQIFEKSIAKKGWWGEIHLTDGWKLIHEKVPDATSLGKSKEISERWVLERNPT